LASPLVRNCFASSAAAEGGNAALLSCVQGEHAQTLITAVFSSLGNEVVSQNLVQMGEILHAFAHAYPPETRFHHTLSPLKWNIMEFKMH
jgi:hypothetical protein